VSGSWREVADEPDLDGEPPLARSGGQLSAGRLHAFGHLHEACLRLRGQAGDRQVEGARVATASAGAGPLAYCSLLRTELTMARTGREVQLVEYPHGEVGPSHFRVAEVDVPDPGAGEVLVRNLFTSVDPGLRLRLRESGPQGYFNSFPLRAAMDEIMTVGEVVESRADGFAAGDTVTHAWGWRDFSVVAAGAPALAGIGTLAKVDTTVAPPEKYLGPVGNMGLTAYVGIVDAAGLREGDVVWVSAAAGAVGSLAAQIAKLRGHRVIGSAGSPDKVRFLLDELGLDHAFSYRDGPIVEHLRQAAPDGIDVYFDNVGGDHLQAALATLRPWGRVALCGAISEYESTEPQPGPSNLFQATSNNLTLRGFRASSYLHRLPDARRELGGRLAEGRLVYRETIVDGLERAPEALARMLSGDTTGKTLVRIAR
jgi:NADPH-dependent curcumin reductase CurA